MQAVLDGLSHLDVRLVLSSKAEAAGVRRARRQGVATEILPKVIDWRLVDQTLRTRGITHIFLLGFMKIVPGDFVDKWAGSILNVHPSLLPKFPGLKAIESSHAAGAAMGVTVHVVTPEMDAGPVLLQRQVLQESRGGGEPRKTIRRARCK